MTVRSSHLTFVFLYQLPIFFHRRTLHTIAFHTAQERLWRRVTLSVCAKVESETCSNFRRCSTPTMRSSRRTFVFLYKLPSFIHQHTLHASVLQYSYSYDDDLRQVHSNAVVESHFRQLKLTTLQKRTRLRPGEIVRRELTYVKAKINERLLADAEKSADAKHSTTQGKRRQQTKKKRGRKTPESHEETWKRRPGRSSYRSPRTARRKLLLPKSTTRTTNTTKSKVLGYYTFMFSEM